MIKPTVGRVVLFKHAGAPGKEFAAIICKVWHDRMVNLAVFDGSGTPMSRTSVTLLQGDGNDPAGNSQWCEWMPYQAGQAAKTQAAEAKVAPRDDLADSALRSAVEFARSNSVGSAGLVVEAAQEFEAFLRGRIVEPAQPGEA